MRKLIAIFIAALVIGGCASDKARKKPGEEVKETPLWKILSYYRTGKENPVNFEDKWFAYRVELEYIQRGKRYETVLFSSCPVAGATYTVYEKKSKELIRQEQLKQVPCDPCHKR